MGYKMEDETYIKVDEKDESKSGITQSLMEKMKQNKEETTGKKSDESKRPPSATDEEETTEKK